jgi:Na+(H+)/acetate symporter ActP
MAISALQPRKPRSPVAVYLALHALAGVLLGGLLGGGLLLTDLLPIHHLVAGSSESILVAFIVVLGGMTTIAPIVFATAVGLLDEKSPTGTGRGFPKQLDLVPNRQE